MTDRFTDSDLGMTFVGNKEVFAALKNQAQNPNRKEKVVVTMPPGGQQGVFATGIAQAIHEQKATNGIDTIIASSAGAGSAYYLIAGADTDEKTRKIAEMAGDIFHTRNPDNQMVKVALRRPVLDLRTLAEMFRDEYPIDPEVFRRSQTKLLVGLSSWETGQHVLLDVAQYKNPLSVVVASMLLPIISTRLGHSNPRIKIDGREYADGGLSNVVPVKSVLEQNPTHYLAIAPQPLDHKELPKIPQAPIDFLINAGFLPKICGNIPTFVEGVSRGYKNLAEQAMATGEINGVKVGVIAPTNFISPLSMDKFELTNAQTNARTFMHGLLNES